jgi:glycosyltransferase involved in cell wall biosynthesis
MYYKEQGHTLKIANVIEEARVGGPQKRIVEVGAQLLESDFETIIVTTPDNHEKLEEISAQAGLKFETLNIIRLRQNIPIIFKYIVKFIPDIFSYHKLFKKLKVDAVHTNGASQWKPAIAAKFAKIPVVWHLNDTRCPTYIRIPFKLFSWLCADAYLVSSNRTREVYLNKNESKPIILARPPVDHRRFSKPHSYKFSTPLVVVTVGNLNPDKDILTYIRLAQLAYAEFKNDIIFKVVGKRLDTQTDYNAQIDAALAKAPHNIEFLGYVENVPELLQGSDVFICTSRSEAGPMSVFEAFAAGVPVVTTDVGDISDIKKQHGNIALVCDVGDEKALFKNLSSLMDSALSEEIGLAGQAFSSSHLDTTQCAHNHELAYNKIA